MVRIALFSILFFVFSVSEGAAQQQVGVRFGEHSDYSRLVFDLGKAVPYTLEKEGSDTLVIAFKDDVTLKSLPDQGVGLRNLSGFQVLDQAPLRVSVNIPDDSRYRHFIAGSRIVIDVYNSPSGKKQDSEQKVEGEALSAVPEEASPLSKPQESMPEPAPKPEIEKVEKEAPPREVKPVEAVPVSDEDLEKLADQEATDVKQAQKEAAAPDDKGAEEETLPRIGANVITFSSTQSMGLAAFTRGDEIWLVNDATNSVLSPNLSGPQAKKIGPLVTVDLQGRKLYRVKSLPDGAVRGQGGGLLWRVVISYDEKEQEPVLPIVQESNIEGATYRKVIFPFKEASALIDVPDPSTGRVLKVATVKNAKEFSGPDYEFVEFETLFSPVGLAILPKVDDLIIEITPSGIEISRTGGLAVSQAGQIENVDTPEQEEQNTDDNSDNWRRVYNFKDWRIGGPEVLDQNKNILLSDLKGMPESRRVEEMITLAKMYLSNAAGPEALGFLKLAEQELPGLGDNPQFIAFKGAARALAWKSEEAFADLSLSELKDFPEIDYWRAFALADLGDWNQAEQVMPSSMGVLFSYPELVFNRLAPVMAEISLRAGNEKQASHLLRQLEKNEETLLPPQKAALMYLKGEAARQRGNLEETREIWGEMQESTDDLYRTKARLALTRLRANEENLKKELIIDALERLRYAWRGDELEAQINYWLGKAYIESGSYVKGLIIMRDAAALAPDTAFGRHITSEMRDVFTGLFLGGGLKNLSPLDATALYEQFAELVPAGKEGDKVVETLAEHLVEADLLDRAIKLLSHQVDHRLEGFDKYRTGVRLAGIQLLYKRPADALVSLKKAEDVLRTLPEESQTPERFHEIMLMRAHALAEQDRPGQALALLDTMEPTPSVNKMRAEVAWNAGYWDDAAEFLEQVIFDQNISPSGPLEDEEATLILHRAVALSLANDRIALANMREKYGDAMAQTDKAKVFEVITRPRQSAALADRDTLMGIVSEVDLFGDFLESYRSIDTPLN